MYPVSLQSATPPRETKSDASIDLEKVPVHRVLAQLAPSTAIVAICAVRQQMF